MKPLYTKYRPDKWDDVIGQGAAVKSLRNIIKRGDAQAFILVGPSGTGKTTLARIAAHEVGCSDEALLEVNAAKNTGIDDMRKVAEVLRYEPFGESKRRAIILDEAHRLSAQAWDSLLKDIEEPPDHIVWFLCTTNAAKLPKTIKTRCATVTLKAVNDKDLTALADDIAEREMPQMPEGVIDVCVQQADGSPRQLLMNMAACADIDTTKAARRVLEAAHQSDEIRSLCQSLLKRESWNKTAGILARLADEPPEGVRIVVMNYMASVIRNTKSESQVKHCLHIMDSFCTPYNQGEGVAPLYLSVGRVLYAG
jgi:DNA polymerase-3 subunit gamma/tau